LKSDRSNLVDTYVRRAEWLVEESMLTVTDYKIIEANRLELIPTLSQLTKPVIIHPNPDLRFTSWLCEHAAPQRATEEVQLIACEFCRIALAAGERIVPDVP
jgi:hypothetical protein